MANDLKIDQIHHDQAAGRCDGDTSVQWPRGTNDEKEEAVEEKEEENNLIYVKSFWKSLLGLFF